ncbi:hypothetical protein L596_005182 [Steinernema carpocapsae]|uniref:K Homology domain-containing protein n=1 Tax=Steinernema carpocapsae TaxID=34508 RepID=A0A4U8UYF2_STECR|nr:hypothetical protein L596_005182 [Steinernema carpocapsae]
MTAFRKGHLKIIRYLVKHVQQFPGDAECHRYLSTLNNDKEKELEEKCRQCLQVVLSAKDKQAAQADAAAKRLLDMLAAEEEQEASRKRSKQKKNEEKRAKRQAKKAEELEAARLKEQQAAEEAEAKRKAKEEARKRAAEKLAKKKEEELLAAQKLAAAKAAEESAVKEEYDTEEEEDDEDEEQDETPYIVEPKFEELEKNYDWTDVDPKDKKELESFAAARARRLVKTPKSSSTLAAPVKSANASPKSETESEWCKAGAPKKKVVPVAKPATKAAAGAAVKAESDDGGVWNNIESSKRRQQVMNLASNQIARVIGRGGTNINTIREATNANIEVEKQLSSRNQGPRNITIKGNAEAVRNAVAMIDILLKEVDLGINQVVARVLQTKHSSSPCPMKSNSAGDQSSEVGADSKQGQSNVWEQRAAIRQGIQKDDIPNEVPVSVSKAPSSTASFDHTEVERVSPVPSVIHAAPIDTFVPPMEDPVPEVVPLPTPDDFSKRKAPGSERASNSATPVTNGEHSHLISPIGAPSAFKTIEPPFPHKITTPAQEVPSLPQPSRLDPLFKSAVNVDVGNIIPRFNSMSVNKMLNSTSTKDENQLAANLFESKLSDIWGSDRTTDLSSTLSNRLGNGGLVDPISAVWMNKDDEPSYNKPSQLPQNQSYDYNVPSYSRPKETTSFTPWSNGSNVPSAQDWSSPASNRHSTWDPLMPSNVNNNKYNPAGSSQSRFDQSGSRQGLSDSLRMGDSYDLNQKLRKDIYSSNPFASQQPQQQQSIGHMRMNQSMDLRRNMYGGYDSSNYHHQQQSMNVQQPSHDMFDTFQSPAVDRSSGLSSYYNPQQQHMNRQSFMSSSQTQQPMRGGNGMHSNFGSIGDPMHSSSSIRAPSQNQQQYGMNSSSFYMPQQSENPRGSGVRDMPMQYGAGTSNVPTNTLYDTWSNPTTQPSSQNQIWSNGSSSGSRNIW